MFCRKPMAMARSQKAPHGTTNVSSKGAKGPDAWIVKAKLL